MASSIQENEQTPQMKSLENLSSKDSEVVLQKEPGSDDGPVSDKVAMAVSDCPVIDESAKRVDEGLVSDKIETTMGDGHASDKVETAVGDGHANDKVETAVGDGHASDKVETAVGEAPVSDTGVEISGEGTVSDKVATTVGEASLSENVASTVGEVPLSDNVVAIASEAPLSVVALASGTPLSNLNDAQLMQGKESGNTEGPSDLSIVKVDEGSSDVKMAEVPVSSSSSIVRVPPEKRTLYKFGQRTSNFRGVTRHRWTGKYEAHLWDNSTITEGRKRKGKQVYLGGYESETKAAQAYDLAALKFWGGSANTKLNFPLSTYEKELEKMKDMSREEYVNSLRRKSICFTRGHSIYRGVTRQNEGRRWQARIGRVAGGKDIYLGTYDTEEEAAEAYDIAAVKLRGMNAITNFDISNYYKEGTKELDVIPIKSIEEEHSHLRIRYFKLE